MVWNSGISEGDIVSSVVLVLASGEMDWNCQYLDVNFMLGEDLHVVYLSLADGVGCRKVNTDLWNLHLFIL